MRGVDEESGEYLGPSRKQNRREALEVLALAEALVGLPDGRLAKLPVPDSLMPHIADTRRITSHIARKRQMAFLAKQMRREDEATLEALRDALDAGGEAARIDTARLHRAEQWRLRLLDEGGREHQVRREGGRAASSQVSATPAGPLRPGAYRLEWRAMGDDGHVMSGAVRFAVNAAR